MCRPPELPTRCTGCDAPLGREGWFVAGYAVGAAVYCCERCADELPCRCARATPAAGLQQVLALFDERQVRS